MTNQELILSGSILEYLLRHSATLFVGLLCLSALALVDFYFIGKLGPDELTAVSFAAPVFFLGINMLLSLGVGIMIVASVLIGKDNLHDVNKVSSAGLCLAFLIGTLMMTGAGYFHDPIFSLLRAERDMIVLLKDYMHLIYVNFVLMALLIASLKILQAFGEVKRQVIVLIIVVGLNLILDPLLIFGVGSFPGWGLTGAAAATMIATSVGVIVLFFMLGKYIHFIPSAFTFSWRKILYLAFPVSLTKTMMPLSNAAITALLAGFGSLSVAAYGIGYRVDLIVLLFLVALSSVAAPFIGQNIGAVNPERIKQCILLSIRIIFIYGILAGFAIITFRENIVSVFTDDPGIRKELSTYLSIAPFGYFLNGLMMLSVAVLEVFNKPLRSALVNLVYFFLLYIPIAIFGGKLKGSVGVFWAYPAAGAIAAVFCAGGDGVDRKGEIQILPFFQNKTPS